MWPWYALWNWSKGLFVSNTLIDVEFLQLDQPSPRPQFNMGDVSNQFSPNKHVLIALEVLNNKVQYCDF